jgi:UvrD/REP helicase N-terminal domain
MRTQAVLLGDGLNRAEQDLIQLLPGNRAIAIVGDVDQSIYRFKHANPDGIQDYNARYPETHDEVLNECRRCPKRVIAIADHLISHNHPGIPGPRLRPLPANAAGEIHLIQWDRRLRTAFYQPTRKKRRPLLAGTVRRGRESRGAASDPDALRYRAQPILPLPQRKQNHAAPRAATAHLAAPAPRAATQPRRRAA